MKIVIDARLLKTSTGRYIERLLLHLQDIDKDSQYIVLLAEKDKDAWSPKADNFQVATSSAPPYTFREQLLLPLQLWRMKADIVHFTMQSFPLLYMGRFVVTIHDLTQVRFVDRRDHTGLRAWYKYTLKPKFFRWFIRRAAKRADHIITPTKFVKEDVASYTKVDEGKISFTHEAAEEFKAEPKVFEPVKEKPFLVYVGNPFPHKNLWRLVEAFSKLQTDHWLVLAGTRSAAYEALEAYTKEQGIDNVLIPGFADDGQLMWLYENATCYVFPSLSEGFGLPGLEAMIYGLPVVSSDATCLPEVYDDAALYFDPHDTDDMAEKISRILEDEDLRNTLRQRGFERVKQFSWRRMAQETLEIYKDSSK